MRGGCRERKGSNADGVERGDRENTRLSGVVVATDPGFVPPPATPSGIGVSSGGYTRTPPLVGGVYRLRAIPTCHRGTDTRYQRTLVAPTSVEKRRRRSAVSILLTLPSPGIAIFYVLIFLSSLPLREPRTYNPSLPLFPPSTLP